MKIVGFSEEINWLVSTPLKNISQIGSSSQLLGKIKNVPNHQPVKEIERVLIFWTWHFSKARILISWPGEQ